MKLQKNQRLQSGDGQYHEHQISFIASKRRKFTDFPQNSSVLIRDFFVGCGVCGAIDGLSLSVKSWISEECCIKFGRCFVFPSFVNMKTNRNKIRKDKNLRCFGRIIRPFEILDVL